MTITRHVAILLCLFMYLLPNIVKAEEHIRDTLIGTINTIVSMSGFYKPSTLLIFMAHTIEGSTKISVRMSQYDFNLNLKEVLGKLVEDFDATLGGHTFAAGAVMPQQHEDPFILKTTEFLENYLLEEEIK